MIRIPPQNGGRFGMGPCAAVTFATSAISAVRDDKGCDCCDAQAPNRLFSDRDA
jgi:hypothetical protein